MGLYRWSEQSQIKEAMLKPYGKALGADIRLSESVTPEQLAQLTDQLNFIGLRTFEDREDDKYILRVRGIKQESVLLATLEKSGLADSSERQNIPTPPEPKPGFMKKAKSRIMVWDGFLTLLGDLFLMIAALRHGKESGKNELKSGAVYGAESLALITMGHTSADRAFEKEFNNLVSFFASNGVPVPKIGGEPPERLGKEGGLFSYASNKFREHPTAFLNVASTVAGVELAKAGFKQRAEFEKGLAEGNLIQDDKLVIQGGKAKAAAGISIATGMFLALLMPEKHKEELAKDAQINPGFLHKVKRFALERPERVASWMAVANNLAQVVSSIQERNGYRDVIKNYNHDTKTGTVNIGGKTIQLSENAYKSADSKKNDWLYTMASSVAYLAANGLLTWASKTGHIEQADGTSSLQDDLHAIAAQYIGRMPPGPERDIMVQKTAYMLATRSHGNETQESISNAISDRIAQRETKTKETSWQQRTATPPKQSDYMLGA